MPLEDRVTSLEVPPALAAALLAVAIVCWPTLTSAQTVPTPQISVDQAFNVAPIGTGAAAQQQTFLELTDWATRAMKKVTQLSDRGRIEPVTQEEQAQLGLSFTESLRRFRVGMFVEYVTSNMLKLYAMSTSQTAATCAEFEEVSKNVKEELQLLGKIQGRGNGTVLGRNAVRVTTKAGCP